jgi:hypothetical protein
VPQRRCGVAEYPVCSKTASLNDNYLEINELLVEVVKNEGFYLSEVQQVMW